MIQLSEDPRNTPVEPPDTAEPSVDNHSPLEQPNSVTILINYPTHIDEHTFSLTSPHSEPPNIRYTHNNAVVFEGNPFNLASSIFDTTSELIDVLIYKVSAMTGNSDLLNLL